MSDRLKSTPNEILPIGDGVPYYPERVVGDKERGLGGIYAGWGQRVTNEELPDYVGKFLGRSLEPSETLELDSKGFTSRHLTLHLSHKEAAEAELMVAERTIKGAIEANGWDPSQLDALVIGMTSPLFSDFTVEMAKRVGIPESAPKVSVDTACDSSMRGLSWVMQNENLKGKKVLLGAVENLSRGLTGGGTVEPTKDTQALQLFANGVGFIGIVPEVSLHPIVVRQGDENMYDRQGALQVAVNYSLPGSSQIEERQYPGNHTVIAGRMPKPVDGTSVKMADNRGMLTLFGHNTADIINRVLVETRDKLRLSGNPDEWFQWVVMHNANFKISRSQSARLEREYKLPLDLTKYFIVGDFGNVSAASPMISWLRQANKMTQGTRGLFVGYGAGGYYDVISAQVP
jgi:3-oxoacyl-[acyl-carrier-protein] synthase III